MAKAKPTAPHALEPVFAELGKDIGAINQNTTKTNDLLNQILAKMGGGVNVNNATNSAELASLKQVNTAQRQRISELESALNRAREGGAKVIRKRLRSQTILNSIGSPEDLKETSIYVYKSDIPSQRGVVLWKKSNAQTWEMQRLGNLSDFDEKALITVEDLRNQVDIDFIYITQLELPEATDFELNVSLL